MSDCATRYLGTRTALLMACVLSVFIPSSSFGGMITVSNHSFELPAVAEDGVGVAESWDVLVPTGSIGVWNVPTPTPGAAPAFFDPLPDGEQVAFNNGGILSQTLSETLAADTQYQLFVAVGLRGDIRTSNFPDFPPNWAVELWAGSELLGRKTQDDVPFAAPFGRFEDVIVTFPVANAAAFAIGQQLRIALVSDSIQANFDNVRLRSDPAVAVPEPASFSLFLVGIAGAALASRAQRRRQRA